jgi:hypothetical protein
MRLAWRDKEGLLRGYLHLDALSKFQDILKKDKKDSSIFRVTESMALTPDRHTRLMIWEDEYFTIVADA